MILYIFKICKGYPLAIFSKIDNFCMKIEFDGNLRSFGLMLIKDKFRDSPYLGFLKNFYEKGGLGNVKG